MDSQDSGSPSKISRRRRMDDLTIKCGDATTMRTSKANVKISFCLFVLSVYIGLYFQETYKLLASFLEPSNAEANVEITTLSKAVPTITGRNATTLALLYPPGMIGGYRNQVLRLIAFVVHATKNNMTQILLPSLLWTTKICDPGFDINNNNTHLNVDPNFQREFPIPFDWVFDVEHWNLYQDHIPILVTTDHMRSVPKLDCWLQSLEMSDIHQLHNATRHVVPNTQHGSHIFYYRYDRPKFNITERNGDIIYINHLQQAVLLQGMIRPIANSVTIPILTNQLTINPRLHNFAPDTEHCRNPHVYGGGKKAGVLWNAYISYEKNAVATAEERVAHTRTNKSFVPFDTDIWIYRALQPAEMWRTVANECIQRHAPTGKYITLHARVELEMMEHICGSGMEKNLSKIVEQVNKLYVGQPGHVKSSLSALLIAVSRGGMELTNNYRNSPFRTIANDNLNTLNRITQNASNAILPAFECGETVLQQFYAANPSIPDHGTLLQSVINFYLAVSSEIFVGVAQSSYSTDILTTRYWLGKGSSNYRYTPNGIEPVENGGLPVPHSNCKNKRPQS